MKKAEKKRDTTIKDLENARKKIADQMYDHYVGKYLTPEVLKTIPSRWVDESSTLFYTVQNAPNSYWGRNRDIEMSGVKKVIKRGDYNQCGEVAKKWVDAIKNNQKKTDEARKVCSDLYTKVNNALKTFTTANKLKNEWPEAFEHLPEQVKDAFLPVVPVKDINKELGL